MSDLYEQYLAGEQSGLPSSAVSRSVAWRAARGIAEDIRWGSANHYRKAVAMGATTGDHQKGRGVRILWNILWAVLAVAFVAGVGVVVAESITVPGSVLGRTELGPGDIATSVLLLLGTMVLFVVARTAQLIGGWATSRRGPQDQGTQ